MPKKKLWSVPRITHPDHPGVTVRVGEYVRGGTVHVFRMINGAQRSQSLKVRRTDLGSTPNDQVKEAQRRGREYIKRLATLPEPALAPVAVASLTLSKLADRYEVDGFAGRTPGYKRDAVAAVRRIAAVLGEDKAVADLKPSDIQRYVAHRLAEKKGLRVAPRSDLVALKIACGWAAGEDLLPVSPFDTFKRKKGLLPPKAPARRPVATPERVSALLAVAPQFPPLFGVLLTLAWETGHRLSAILELRWKDVLFQKTKSQPHGAIAWYADAAPTNKRHPHLVPITAAARAALERWQQHAPGVGAAPVFPTTAREFAKRTWRKAERAATLPHLPQGGWHTLRRGWRTLRKGLPDRDVQEAGGWNDTATMNLCYTGTDDASVLAAVEGS